MGPYFEYDYITYNIMFGKKTLGIIYFLYNMFTVNVPIFSYFKITYIVTSV
jgi:hypothetical protein